MASFIGSDKDLLCPVCTGRYCAPRKLPGCVHSFCEKCVLNLVINLKKDDKLGTEFECPVCRLPSKSPDEEEDITVEWVQKMERDTELEAKIEKQDEYDSEYCSQCKYLDKYIKSRFYCSTCMDVFCESCSKTLHSFKVTKAHVVIDVSDGSENQTVREQAIHLLQKYLACTTHPDKHVEFYCEAEEKLYCVECATTEHQHCENVKTIRGLTEEDADEERDETKSKKILYSLSKLTSHIQAIICLVQEKDTELKKSQDIISQSFQEMKQKVVRLLDIAEENIMQESKAAVKDISIKNADEIQELNNIASELSVVEYLVNNLIGSVSREHASICYTEAYKTFLKLERKIVERGLTYETQEISLKTENMLGAILNLGPNDTDQAVNVSSVDKRYPLPRYDEDFQLRAGKVDKIDSRNCIADGSTNAYPKYCGVQFLPDDLMVLTDGFNGVVSLFDTDSKPLDSFSFKVNETTRKSKVDLNLINVSYQTNGLIAVSVSASKKICFLSVDGDMLEQTGEITCEYSPVAIHCFRSGDIAVLWKTPTAFGIVSLNGGTYKEKVYFAEDTRGMQLKFSSRMVVDEERRHVILPFKTLKIVTCYDFEGNKIFSFENAALRDVKGVALDRDGSIYICEYKYGYIIVISPEGIFSRIIRDGCPANPLAIGFNFEGNKFAVITRGDESQKVHFFSIKRESKSESES